MKIAAIDPGDTTGLVILGENDVPVVVKTTTDTAEVMTLIQLHKPAVVLMERGPRIHQQYQWFKIQLAVAEVRVVEIAPGEWKPNPLCRCSAAAYPGWSKHCRDAMSLVRCYQLKIGAYRDPNAPRKED